MGATGAISSARNPLGCFGVYIPDLGVECSGSLDTSHHGPVAGHFVARRGRDIRVEQLDRTRT